MNLSLTETFSPELDGLNAKGVYRQNFCDECKTQRYDPHHCWSNTCLNSKTLLRSTQSNNIKLVLIPQHNQIYKICAAMILEVNEGNFILKLPVKAGDFW